MDRFSKLYGNSAVKKAEQKLSMQLSKNQKAPDANGNRNSGLYGKKRKKFWQNFKAFKKR